MKYRILNLALLLFTLGTSLRAAKGFYPVATIPETMMNKAKAVVRMYDESFVLQADNKATTSIRCIITILHEDALDEAEIHIPYDKFSRVSAIQASIYDEQGKRISKMSPSDIVDYCGPSSYAGYEDHRVKIISTNHRTLPFTLEYSYEIHYTGLLHYPYWDPQPSYDLSVEQSRFQAIVPSDLELRYYEQNFPVEVSMSSRDNNKIYSWEVSQLPPVKWEPYDPPIQEYSPMVFLAASDFELDGYKGNAETWEDFGKWFSQLNADRDELPIETSEFIKELVKDCTSAEEKVEKIYSWMQSQTRYVNVSLGIGGFQPFAAEVVDLLKYGDCKALSNYTQALLKAAGIPSIYTLVRAGSSAPRIQREFPGPQFNHAFLCVPLTQDTLWLECTSQTTPCGYLGTFTDNRDVLLITEEGGKLVHTPTYTEKENYQIHCAEISLDESGNGSAKIANRYGGTYYSKMEPFLRGDQQDKKKLLYQDLEIPNFSLHSFSHEEQRSKLPVIHEKIDLELRNYGTVMGDRMLITLNLMNRMEPLVYSRERRRSDIQIRRAYKQTDTIQYTIPSNFALEAIPENQVLTSKFGSYRTTVNVDGSVITYIRELNVAQGTFDSSEYPDFFDYIEKLSQLDKLQAVLVRKE
ncbi:MAG: DUF3857 domain-containing protein [Bacteroidales bacterium]|nr:DUF3857 domain-containing protein [Bacteroidales bacterium]